MNALFNVPLRRSTGARFRLSLRFRDVKKVNRSTLGPQMLQAQLLLLRMIPPSDGSGLALLKKQLLNSDLVIQISFGLTFPKNP